MNSERRRERYGHRLYLTLALVLVAGAGPTFAQVEGVWESIERSEGGVGITYEFGPDGTACASPGAMVDYVYQFAGGKVQVLNADLSENPETVMAFRFESDRLVADAESEAPPLVRADDDSSPDSPVGVWKYIDTDQSDEELGGEQAALIRRNTRLRLTSTGQVQLRIPFRVDCGPYQIDGSTLRMVRGDQTITPGFKVQGDTLVLTALSGAQASFKRLAP